MKETPCERKAREQGEKARAREGAKQSAYIKKQAAQIISKAPSALASLDGILARRDVSLVSRPLAEPIVAARDFLQQACADASVVLASEPGDALPELVNLTELAERVAVSKKDVALVTNMLALVAQRTAR